MLQERYARLFTLIIINESENLMYIENDIKDGIHEYAKSQTNPHP